MQNQKCAAGYALSKANGKLADVLLTMERCGFVLYRKEVLELVSQFVTINSLRTSFENGITSEDFLVSKREIIYQ